MSTGTEQCTWGVGQWGGGTLRPQRCPRSISGPGVVLVKPKHMHHTLIMFVLCSVASNMGDPISFLLQCVTENPFNFPASVQWFCLLGQRQSELLPLLEVEVIMRHGFSSLASTYHPQANSGCECACVRACVRAFVCVNVVVPSLV